MDDSMLKTIHHRGFSNIKIEMNLMLKMYD